MYSAVTMKRLVESRDLLVAYFDGRKVLAIGLESELVTSDVLASLLPAQVVRGPAHAIGESGPNLHEGPRLQQPADGFALFQSYARFGVRRIVRVL